MGISVSIPCNASLFRQLSTKDELSNRQTISITKDQTGYIWIATHTGIDKYNGDGFISYKLENSTPLGIITNTAGNIFAYTTKNIFSFSRDNDRFVSCKNLKLPKNTQITSLFPAKNQNLWVGTNQGLYLLCIKTKNRHTELTGTSISAIQEDNQSNLYIATNKGIILFKYKTDKSYQKQVIKTLNIIDTQTLYFDKQTGFLWIGTRKNGVYVYNTHNKHLSALRKETASFSINKIISINNNKIWIGSNGGGIFEFNRLNLTKEDDYAKYTYVHDQIKANKINDILSSDNFLWVCTNTAGVFIYNKEKIADKVYKKIEGSHSSLSNNKSNVILEDRGGNIWFGSSSALSRYNEQTGICKNYPNLSNCSALALDQQEETLLVGRQNTITRVFSNGSTQNLKIQDQAFNRTPNNIIRSLFKDEENNLWVGSSNANLIQIQKGKRKIINYNIIGVNKILSYSKDTLYVCTSHGLYELNKKSGIVHLINPAQTTLKGTPNINGVAIDPKDKNGIWLSTSSSGLLYYNTSTKTSLLYNTRNGLSSNNLSGISIDEFGRIWVGTDNGLNCLNPENQSFDVFHKVDGLPSDTFSPYAYTKKRNGNMIWGTLQGAFEFSPEQFNKKEDKSLNLHFEGLTIFSNATQNQSNPTSQNRAIDDIQQLKLDNDEQSFNIRFFNLSYFSQSEVHYRWMLENYDRTWTHGKNQHTATYTNVPTGDYIFTVQAFMVNNPHHFITKKIKISIAPPFWATPLAYIFYLLIGIGLIFLALKAYKNKLDFKYSQAKIQFFTHMAHDIRTPLTLIKAPLQELKRANLSSEAKESLELALANTDKLLDMVSQLLDFQKIEQEAMALHVEEACLSVIFTDIVKNFQILAKSKDIVLSARIAHNVYTGWVDVKKVTIILENLLSNALKYTPKKGNVLLDISQNEHLLTIKIIDDGIGISAESKKKLFHQYFRGKNAINTNESGTGIGLLFTKKLIELHKGRIVFESRLNVGSSFEITIPVLKESYTPLEILYKKESTTTLFPETKSTSERRDERKIHLLLVEDNDGLRDYMASLLAKTYTVSQAVNGQEALDFVKKTPPDFIVSDVLMPQLSGIELCSAIKSNISTCHIPVILLSAITERETIIRGINAGADDYLTKPFDISVLEGKIAGRLRNRALYRQKFLDKKSFEENVSQSTEIDQAFLNRIILHIEENITDIDLSIDTLAAEMAMSRSVFYKRIKGLTNQNPKDLVRDIKMRKAIFLLRENKHTIADIAYLTGHQNTKYFSTAFKKYYGVSPSTFIENELNHIEKTKK